MTKQPNTKAKLDDLRKKAEKKLSSKAAPKAPPVGKDPDALIHELRVHQIELEMQNEELRGSRAELDASHRKYADLYNFAPVGYITMDKRGLIKEANFTFAKLLGLERALFINKPLQVYVDPADQDVFFTHKRNTFSNGAPQTCEIRLKRKTGVPLYVQLESVPVEEKDEEVVICRTTITDIAARKRAEDELRQSRDSLEEKVKERTADLEELNRNLVVANNELEAFSYSVAHDLRNPLQSILSCSEILSNTIGPKLAKEDREALEYITRSSERMSRIIADFQVLSKVTQQEMHREKVNLSAIAQDFLSELKASHPQRDVEVSIQPDLVTDADPGLARILLENFIRNAWKFTSTRKQARIELCARNEKDGSVTYFVRDNGVGFDMADAGKIFKPFQRLHKDKEFPGTGIGLATVKRIVDKHGGAVWAEAEKGKGATFYFRFFFAGGGGGQRSVRTNPLRYREF